MAGDSKLFQEALKRGSAHAWNEQWDKAADEYRRALKEFPEDVSARTYLAMALYKSGAFRESLDLYKGLMNAQPSNLTMLQRVGELQQKVGDNLDAAVSYGRLADAHTRRGAPREAFKAWQRLVELTPGNPVLWNSLVTAALQVGAAKEIIPGYLGLARDFALQSRFQEAIQIAERAQTLDPQSPLVAPMLAAIRKGIEYSFRAASFGEEVYPEDLMRYIPSVEVLTARLQNGAPVGHVLDEPEDAVIPALPQDAGVAQRVLEILFRPTVESMGRGMTIDAVRNQLARLGSVVDVQTRVEDRGRVVFVIMLTTSLDKEFIRRAIEQSTSERIERGSPVDPQDQPRSIEILEPEPAAAGVAEQPDEEPASGSGETAESGPESLLAEPAEGEEELLETAQPEAAGAPVEPVLEEVVPPDDLGVTVGAEQNADHPEEPTPAETLAQQEEALELPLDHDETPEDLIGADLPGGGSLLEEPEAEEASFQAPEVEEGEALVSSPPEGMVEDVEVPVPEAIEGETETPVLEEIEEEVEIPVPEAVEEESEASPLAAIEEEIEIPGPEVAEGEEEPLPSSGGGVELGSDEEEPEPGVEEAIEAAEPEPEMPPVDQPEVETVSIGDPQEEPFDAIETEPDVLATETELDTLAIEMEPEETVTLEEETAESVVLEEEPVVLEEPEEAVDLEEDSEEPVVLDEEPDDPVVFDAEPEALADGPVEIENRVPEEPETEASGNEAVSDEPASVGEPEPEAILAEEPERESFVAGEVQPADTVETAGSAAPEIGEAAVEPPAAEVAVPGRDEILDRLMRQAEEARSSGRIDDAIAAYEEAVAANLAGSRHLLELGELYEASGNPEGASGAFARATALSPDMVRARLGLARIDLQQHRLDSAEAHARTCVEQSIRDDLGPEKTSSIGLLLEVLRERTAYGDLGRAAEGLGWLKAVASAARLPASLAERVSSVPRDLLGPTVGEHLDEIAALPRFVRGEVTTSLWKAEKMLGDHKLRTAADEMYRVVSTYPEFLPAQSLLGRVLVAQGRLTEAGERSQRLVELYQLRGKAESALEVLEWMTDSGLASESDMQRLNEFLRAQGRERQAVLVEEETAAARRAEQERRAAEEAARASARMEALRAAEEAKREAEEAARRAEEAAARKAIEDAERRAAAEEAVRRTLEELAKRAEEEEKVLTDETVDRAEAEVQTEVEQPASTAVPADDPVPIQLPVADAPQASESQDTGDGSKQKRGGLRGMFRALRGVVRREAEEKTAGNAPPGTDTAAGVTGHDALLRLAESRFAFGDARGAAMLIRSALQDERIASDLATKVSMLRVLQLLGPLDDDLRATLRGILDTLGLPGELVDQ